MWNVPDEVKYFNSSHKYFILQTPYWVSSNLVKIRDSWIFLLCEKGQIADNSFHAGKKKRRDEDLVEEERVTWAFVLQTIARVHITRGELQWDVLIDTSSLLRVSSIVFYKDENESNSVSFEECPLYQLCQLYPLRNVNCINCTYWLETVPGAVYLLKTVSMQRRWRLLITLGLSASRLFEPCVVSIHLEHVITVVIIILLLLLLLLY